MTAVDIEGQQGAVRLVTVQDHTSKGTLTQAELFKLTWGLGVQATYQFNTSPWVEHGYSEPLHVLPLTPGVAPPPGAFNLILLDDSTQAGALGFHEDENGTEIPYADVFVKTAREAGVSPIEVASHEMLEGAVDPDVVNFRKVTYNGKEYIVEVCDPVQGCGYDVGLPGGRTTGIIVADFCWPAWFGMSQSREGMSYRRSVQQAFTLAEQGYISVAPEGTENWTQIFGDKITELPKWASRLPRIHAR